MESNETKRVRLEDGVSVCEDTSYDQVMFYPHEGVVEFRRPFDPQRPELLEIARSGRPVTLTLFDDPDGTVPRLRVRDGKLMYRVGYTPGSKGITELIEIRGGVIEVIADGASSAGTG